MSPTLKLPDDLTVAEFREWCPEDGQRWQLVDGEPVSLASVPDARGRLLAEAGRLLANHLERIGSPCVVSTTPGIVPHANARHNVRVPDIGVSCAPPAANQLETRDPVLLVEILSHGNARQTRANVWAYTTIPALREILVLHQDERKAELLRRAADGTWPKEPEIMIEGDLALDSIGFRAPLAALYRTTALAG
ncbi:Uma2 family endonuclease [Roseomonas sp. AR75]|uniref:Uma2 family endonuclease n=1 Tax=Roseomonas sp. AR75 TaxID=2562311 RepID=UPI001485011C|nr:Uma2 family endonuclease [Roseomonas sp. AR75]